MPSIFAVINLDIWHFAKELKTWKSFLFHPVSAFYAENYNKRISVDGYIWSKSKFLGLSIGVHMIGQAVISVMDYDEEYIITFPNGYGR